MERSVYSHIDLSKQNKIIEVGCGVGAQTEILLERFPHLHIDGIDASASQLKRAKEHLKTAIRDKRVSLQVADALQLPFKDDAYDGAFLCWILEHVQDPVGILSEVRRVLKPSGLVYCSEVLNATLYLHPYSPATLQYWFAFNDHQWNLGGDPFVGAKLANYLLKAGYQNISTETKVEYYDNRMPKRRAEFIDYWTRLLLSGAPGLLQSKIITQDLVDEMQGELNRLKHDPDSVFFYSWIQARAQAF